MPQWFSNSGNFPQEITTADAIKKLKNLGKETKKKKQYSVTFHYA